MVAPAIATAQSILPNARTQFINSSGQPLVGGTVGFYVPGTLTPKLTYSNQALSTPNANPLTLDSLGSALIWGSGSYREIVKNSAGVTIWDAVTASASGGSGGGVTSFNSRTGVVTLTSADVNGALGYTAQNCPTAGTGIGVSCAGTSATISATGGITQNVTEVADVTALRALTVSTIPVVVMQNYTNATGGGGGIFNYNASDTTTADNSCTIIVDNGGHRWYRQYNGPINVRWCGAIGDYTTDDVTAIRAAFAVGPTVYLPPSATCYKVSNTLTISANQSVYGDDPTVACIKASTAANAIFIVPVHNDTTDQNISIAGLTLDRAVAATAGGDGIGFTSYVNNVSIDNVVSKNQYVGINLRSTDVSFIRNSRVETNYSDGLLMTSSAWYPTMQWQLINLYSVANGGRGYAAVATAAAGCGSLGEWINLATYANTSFGVDVEGLSASDCLQGFRLTGGFFGQDGNDEIHLNNYNTGAGQNTVSPKYVELAGTSLTGRAVTTPASGIGSGIYLSANVGPTIVLCTVCNQNAYDGLTTLSPAFVQVVGGAYTNNGQPVTAVSMTNGLTYTIAFTGTTSFTSVGSSSNAVGTTFVKSGAAATGTGLIFTPGRANGINIAAGGAKGTQIGAITAGNTAGSTNQQYGVVMYGGGDYVSVTGANLLNNVIDYGTGIATTNSVIAGVLPIAANTAPAGSYCLLTGCTISGNLTVTGTTTSTTDLVANGTTHLNGVTALNDNVNLAASKQISGGASSGITVDNLRAAVSAAVGTVASGVAGRLDTTTLVASGVVSGTTGTFSGAVSGTTGTFSGALSGTTLASSGLATLNSLSVTNAMSINGGMTVVGATGITGTSAGITMQDGAFTRSVGIGTGASGVTGQLAVSSAEIIGTPTGSYQSNSINVAGQFLINNVATAGGSFCALSGCTMTGPITMSGNNISGIGTLGTSGLATLGSLSVTGAMSINSGLTIVGATGITGSSSGITMQDAAFTRSLGVGTGASGVTGRIDGTTIITSSDITGGRDIKATRSLGVGTNPSGTTGYGTFSDTIIAAGGSFSSGAIGGFFSATGDVAGATLHVSGASALHGTTVVSGGVAITGGLNVDNVAVAGGVSIGAATGGVGSAGTLNVQTGLFLNSSAYTFP